MVEKFPYDDLLNDAYVNSWIPCGERMPEVGDPVLIVMSNGEIALASLDSDKIGLSNADNWYNMRNVTHWMPLPEPPKGE